MRIICIINRKGGVGKSTSASALASCLANSKKKVLVVDLDAQRNLTYTMIKETPRYTSMDVLTRRCEMEDAILEADKNIDIVPASENLSTADLSIVDVGKEFRLRESLSKVADRYDYCIIDTPPALGVLTVNALTAADSCIIPVQAEIFSLQGTGDLYSLVRTVKQYTNPKLTISGILVTRCNARAIVTKELISMLEDTAEKMGTKVYESMIRECSKIKEAQAKRESLFTYAPNCNAALDYRDFYKEFTKDEKSIKEDK